MCIKMLVLGVAAEGEKWVNWGSLKRENEKYSSTRTGGGLSRIHCGKIEGAEGFTV